MANPAKKTRMGLHRSARTWARESEPPELSIDEAADLYPGEWIFMKVLAVDEHDSPVRGQILAHSPHRIGIVQAEKQALSSAERPEHSYWSGQAVHYITTGQGMRESLDALWREGKPGGWGR